MRAGPTYGKPRPCVSDGHHTKFDYGLFLLTYRRRPWAEPAVAAGRPAASSWRTRPSRPRTRPATTPRGTPNLMARDVAEEHDGGTHVENSAVSRCVDFGARPEHRACPGHRGCTRRRERWGVGFRRDGWNLSGQFRHRNNSIFGAFGWNWQPRK